MFAVIDWPSFLGVGVALVVGVIAFVIASGFVNPRKDRADSSGGPSSIRRAS